MFLVCQPARRRRHWVLAQHEPGGDVARAFTSCRGAGQPQQQGGRSRDVRRPYRRAKGPYCGHGGGIEEGDDQGRGRTKLEC